MNSNDHQNNTGIFFVDNRPLRFDTSKKMGSHGPRNYKKIIQLYKSDTHASVNFYYVRSNVKLQHVIDDGEVKRK